MSWYVYEKPEAEEAELDFTISLFTDLKSATCGDNPPSQKQHETWACDGSCTKKVQIYVASPKLQDDRPTSRQPSRQGAGWHLPASPPLQAGCAKPLDLSQSFACSQCSARDPTDGTRQFVEALRKGFRLERHGIPVCCAGVKIRLDLSSCFLSRDWAGSTNSSSVHRNPFDNSCNRTLQKLRLEMLGPSPKQSRVILQNSDAWTRWCKSAPWRLGL